MEASYIQAKSMDTYNVDEINDTAHLSLPGPHIHHSNPLITHPYIRSPFFTHTLITVGYYAAESVALEDPPPATVPF